jgi:hypothetical protein
MLKIGRVFQITEHRYAVDAAFRIRSCRRRAKLRCAQQACAETEHVPPGE